MIKTLTLHVEIEYETNGEDPKALKTLLEQGANHLASQGLFSGETQAEVETWNAWVTES